MFHFKIYLSITHGKILRKQYKTNKLKIIALHSYSVSDIQDYIEYLIKKHETLTAIPSIHIYMSRINNRLLFISQMNVRWI